MTLEDLQQENEKLNARLQKAITVFGEQKNNIAVLTQERDLYKAKSDELEVKLNQNSGNDEKFFEQLSEINDLKAKLELNETKLTDLDVKNNELTVKNANLEAQKTSIVSQLDLANSKLEACDKLLTEKDDKIKELTNEIQTKEENLSKAKEEFNTKIDSISVDLQKMNNEYVELNTKYNSLKETYEKSTTDLAQKDLLIGSLESRIKDIESRYGQNAEHIETAKKTVEQIKQLGDNLINNFNLFA